MNKVFKLIKELLKTPKGKALLFFGFYFVFFLVIAILARISPGNVNDESLNQNKLFSLSDINGNNYSYECNINIDNNIFKINGVKMQDKEKFTYIYDNIQKDYYKEGSSYYLDEHISEIPSWYFNLIDNLDYLVNNSTYVSVTNYESGKNVLRYILSSASISKLVDNKDLDIEEIPNEINITKNNNRVDEVDIIFSSYCISTNKCTNYGKLSILYNNFGKIESID